MASFFVFFFFSNHEQEICPVIEEFVFVPSYRFCWYNNKKEDSDLL